MKMKMKPTDCVNCNDLIAKNKSLLVDLDEANKCTHCGEHLLEMAKLTKEILEKEAMIKELTKSLGQMTDMAMEGNVK